MYVLEGGSRSSKTYSIIQFFILYAINNSHRPNRIVIARKKGTWLSATVWNDFQAILLEMGLMPSCSINKTLKTIRLYSTVFEFIGLDDTQKLHGLTMDVFWVNEAMECHLDDFDQLEQRCARFSILDYNPSAEEHWIYDSVCGRDDCYFDHSTMLDNPFIPTNMKRKILSYEPTEFNYSQGTVDIRKWKIYGLGKRAKIEGLIFNNYTLIKEVPIWVKRRWQGLDFGYTADPTACEDVGFLENALYIDELFYATNMLTKDIINSLKQCPSRKIWSESADPRLTAEIYNAGFNIHQVQKYAGSIMAGIDFMKGVKIYITENSLNIKKEFDNYTYKQDKTGKWLNEPVDNYNHCFTGDTIIETINGGRRIDSIKIGDSVLTSNGYKLVNKVFENGQRKILQIRLIFSNFEVVIKATPDHKFKTALGWKKLEQLTKGDKLFILSNLTESDIVSVILRKDIEVSERDILSLRKIFGNIIMGKPQANLFVALKMAILQTWILKTFKCCHVKILGQSILKNEKIWSIKRSMEKPFTDTKTKDTSQRGQVGCISPYGDFIMAMFLKGMRFIIKISIAPITIFLTLFVLLKKSIERCTRRYQGNSVEARSNSSILVALGIRQKNGTQVKLAESGILSMAKELLKRGRKNRLFARYVESTTPLSNMRQDFAPIIVNQNTEDLQGSTMKKGYVESVEQNLQQINTVEYSSVVCVVLEDIQVEKETRANVFDLEVAETHEYFANGILVHNCIDGIRYVCLMELMGKRQGVGNYAGVFPGR